MSEVQIFHATLDGARELEEAPFRKERDLQRFIEFHLNDLFGIEFLDTEHSTGPHDKQRIDSLGIDARGRPVVIEYKLRSDKNIINQGLGYLDWLDKHPESIELLAIKKLGPDKAQRVDLKRPRLLCIAGAFTRNDIVTAENCRASVELVRYCRYGDTSFLLEWVHGGRVAPKVEKEEKTRRRDLEKQQSLKDRDYRKYQYWKQLKDNSELYDLFESLCEHAHSLGDDVRMNPTKEHISLQRKTRFGYVSFRPNMKLFRLNVRPGPDPKNIRLQDGFTELQTDTQATRPFFLQITIRNHDDLERAKPLIKRSYDEAG